MYTDAIILDEDLTRGLVSQALRDGYVKPSKTVVSETDPSLVAVDQKIMSAYKRSKLASKALPYLLLYPKVYVYHACETVDISGLSKHIPITPIVPASLEKECYSYLCSDEGQRAAKAFKPVLLPSLRYASRKESLDHLRINSETYDLYVDLFRRDNHIASIGNFFNMAKDPRVLAKCAMSFNINPDIFINKLLSQDKDRQLSIYNEIALKMMTHITDIADQVTDLLELLKLSGSMNVPAALSIKFPMKSIYSNKQSHNFHLNEDFLRCYYIFIEEINAFPVIESLDDVLRMREDKRIVYWREALQDWALEIKSGNIQGEQRMRQSIRSAMRDLKRLGKVRTISGVMTILSVPLAVAELLMPAFGLGYTMSGISVALEAYSKNREWKHDWLMLGKT